MNITPISFAEIPERLSPDSVRTEDSYFLRRASARADVGDGEVMFRFKGLRNGRGFETSGGLGKGRQSSS